VRDALLQHLRKTSKNKGFKEARLISLAISNLNISVTLVRFRMGA
jgi:hypothetical protein